MILSGSSFDDDDEFEGGGESCKYPEKAESEKSG